MNDDRWRMDSRAVFGRRSAAKSFWCYQSPCTHQSFTLPYRSQIQVASPPSSWLEASPLVECPNAPSRHADMAS
jgi:hypothetical protein